MLDIQDTAVQLGQRDFRFSLRVDAGEIVVILGPSGSGKSTLLNLIAGFLLPHSGDIKWQDQSLLSLRPDQRPVTTLFQKHNLFMHLTVWKNMALGLRPSAKLNDDEAAKLHAALARVGLEGYAMRKPAELSGGEQQRVALARSLLTKKPVLLLDEPYSALDRELRVSMLELTQSIVRNSQLATVLVTHDPSDAEALGARSVKLRHGMLNPRE